MFAGFKLAAGLVAIAVLLLAPLCHAQIPLQMNYQVMLTNDMDEPLADQSVELVFRIYSVDAGGSSLWSETHNTTTNGIGVVSVILGATTPLDIDFSSSLWLQIEVNGEVMSPRRALVSAPYALHSIEALHASDADHAGEADHATDSDQLGGAPASYYVFAEDLFVPGSLNDPGNPVDWTNLKSVPAGFADGTDDVGTGVGGTGSAGFLPKFTAAATIANSAIYETLGQVTIGTTTADGKLTVENSGDVQALYVTNTSPSTLAPVVEFERTEPLGANSRILRLVAEDGSTGGRFLECLRRGTSGSYSQFWIDVEGGVYAQSEMDITSDTDRVIDATGDYESGDTRVVSGVYALGGGGTYDAMGVYGESIPQDWYGVGGMFKGGYIGAECRVDPTGSNDYYGLVGSAVGGSGFNHGVYGLASGGDIGYGVYGIASSGSVNWAGYFLGDARVTGTFTNPGPVLELDHPSDPENMYLRHALVASPEMKTVYDGTVALDDRGEATIELPDWFETMNADFRYQLTPVGAPGPGLYVANTVSDGRFRIAGGEPGMTVSWQVTGVRHDAYARHRPLVVEEEKRPEDRGRYITPEAYGATKESGIGYTEDRKKNN